MKNIILIRHSKSSWDIPVLDFDRKLTVGGVQKAIAVAQNSKDSLPTNFIIWSSSAARASATAKLFVENWGIQNPKITFLDELYTFNVNKLIEIVKSCPNENNDLILFCHNSAITDFVNKFGDIFIDNVPTAGLVSIIFETKNWDTITKGKTDKILFPRDC